jgi:glutaconyl-CoA/methylmalonyl-CoA decarboxylase subunit gamma
MKKYNFTILGNKYDVDIIKIEDNIAEVDVNGSIYEVEIEQELQQQSKTPTLVRQKTVPSGSSGSKKTHKPTRVAGAGQIKAPLPGTILELKVKEGDDVKIGQTVLIMEAMKMENDIKAATEGKVTSVKIGNGDSVMEGDVLVEIGD